MKVLKDNVVAVSYELHGEGELADKATADAPLQYIHGSGMLLPKFEAALEGKEPGEGFAFTLSPEEGYGTHNPALLVKLPLSAFMLDGKVMTEFLVVGRTLPMLNNAGQVVQGTIKAVDADSVTMDFNHPMAGKTLNFKGRVIENREATQEEIQHLIKHMTGGCGGNCSGCGDHGCGDHEGGCGCGDHEHHHHDGGCGCGHCH